MKNNNIPKFDYIRGNLIKNTKVKERLGSNEQSIME